MFVTSRSYLFLGNVCLFFFRKLKIPHEFEPGRRWSMPKRTGTRLLWWILRKGTRSKMWNNDVIRRQSRPDWPWYCHGCNIKTHSDFHWIGGPCRYSGDTFSSRSEVTEGPEFESPFCHCPVTTVAFINNEHAVLRRKSSSYNGCQLTENVVNL
jgi:hypothetical protein